MAQADRTRRVFLIGFMGAGKTTVGRALARRLGWAFCDLDDVIEERERKAIAAIFAEQGEAAFRQAESAALEVLLQEREQGNRIVALGGGAFVQPQNRTALEQAGAVTVLLEAPLEELRRRCRADNGSRVRPLAQQEDRFAELLIARRPAYEQAQHRVQTMGKNVEEVAAEIECILAAASPEVKK
jgi:shikimate kinase